MLAVGMGATIALGLLGGVLTYVIWGSVILHENRADMGGNLCDEEHIWIYTLFCVVLVASGLCCGVGLCNQAVCSRNEQGQYQPGMFPIITATVGLGMFLWGLLQYLLITKNCADQFKQQRDLRALWNFFYVSIILQAIGAVLQVLFFIVLCLLPDKKRPELDEHGNEIAAAGDADDQLGFLAGLRPHFWSTLFTASKEPMPPQFVAGYSAPITSDHVIAVELPPPDEETPLLS